MGYGEGIFMHTISLLCACGKNCYTDLLCFAELFCVKFLCCGMHCVVCSSSLYTSYCATSDTYFWTLTLLPGKGSRSPMFSLLLSVFKIDIFLQGALATYTVVALWNTQYDKYPVF